MIILWIPVILIGVILGIAVSPFYIAHAVAHYVTTTFQLSVLAKMKK